MMMMMMVMVMVMMVIMTKTALTMKTLAMVMMIMIMRMVVMTGGSLNKSKPALPSIGATSAVRGFFLSRGAMTAAAQSPALSTQTKAQKDTKSL